MKIVNDIKKFPLYSTYAKKFPVTSGTVFAYDDTIYSNYPMPDHLIVHEVTHLEQQKRIGLAKWVDLYLSDDQFRLDQEVEAYKNQVRSVKNKSERFKIAQLCADSLASDLYGNLITKSEAFKLIYS